MIIDRLSALQMEKPTPVSQAQPPEVTDRSALLRPLQITVLQAPGLFRQKQIPVPGAQSGFEGESGVGDHWGPLVWVMFRPWLLP